jgi:hypothetical protein
MMDRVWLVMGTNDEYECDDFEFQHSDWCVAAYPDNETAEQHARLANEYASLTEETEARGEGEEGGEASPYDVGVDNHTVWTLLARYYVTEVPLVLHVDQYLERYSE